MMDVLYPFEKAVRIFSVVPERKKAVHLRSRYTLNFRSTFLIASLLCFSAHINAEEHKTIVCTMRNAEINANDELVVTASPSSSASDFDFLFGTHRVHHKKLKARLAGCADWEEFSGTHKMESLLTGIGNLEQHVMNTPDGRTEGMALRLFNPTTRLWTIHWANSHSGTLEAPVIGSFDGPTGFFYGNDYYQDKPILIQFKWDATNPEKPAWSQAFSVDKGETWEWNWHMLFSKSDAEGDGRNNTKSQADSVVPIGVIELRNYVIKHGQRDSFIHYFEENFIESQEGLNASILGQYRVKGADDNFCWIRGFKDMRERSHFLPSFYYGSFWNQHKAAANAMLANNDNVYLLKPLARVNDSLEVAKKINLSLLVPTEGIAVVEFTIANTKLDQLLRIYAREYLPLLESCGIHRYSLWTSVLEENDFPRLPVFQDKNLLVSITFYKNEGDYEEAMNKLDSKMSDELKTNLRDVITTKNAMILYPTEKTIKRRARP